MVLKFRNLNVDPDAPVEQWGFEGLLAAVERGDIRAWHRIAEEVYEEPRGKVASELAEVLAAVENSAMTVLFSRILQRALDASEAEDRQEVVAELADYLERSGLSRKEIAHRLGTFHIAPVHLSQRQGGSLGSAANQGKEAGFKG